MLCALFVGKNSLSCSACGRATRNLADVSTTINSWLIPFCHDCYSRGQSSWVFAGGANSDVPAIKPNN
jgi:uncharacterized radical SAM superfamily protein